MDTAIKIEENYIRVACQNKHVVITFSNGKKLEFDSTNNDDDNKIIERVISGLNYAYSVMHNFNTMSSIGRLLLSCMPAIKFKVAIWEQLDE